MSEMVERVAMAMVESGSGSKEQWTEYTPMMKATWLDKARAAIAEMREPTKEMADFARANPERGYRFYWNGMLNIALGEHPGDWYMDHAP